MRLTKDAQRQIRGGHPWIYDASITSISHDGAIGDLAVVFDDDRRFLAIGLYDPGSPLRVRVLHHGQPRAIDDEFWAERIAAALERRAPIAASADTNAYRVIHGENDQLPGLVLDRYDQTYVLKLDTAAWLPHLRAVVGVLMTALAPASIVLRLSRSAKADAAAHGLTDGVALQGVAPEHPVRFHENGLVFEADVVRGHKTGHFLDQRDNRARVQQLAAGRRVLDVFSCTGGFTVHAAAGGAVAVHSVDLSAPAIAALTRNLELNATRPEVRRAHATSTVGDAFTVMEDLASSEQRFGLVIVDPPSFASKQADVARSVGAYRRLTALALDLVEPEGILVQSSCSSRVPADVFFGAVDDAARTARRPLQELDRTANGIDHPVGFANGAYLKTLFARIPPLR